MRLYRLGILVAMGCLVAACGPWGNGDGDGSVGQDGAPADAGVQPDAAPWPDAAPPPFPRGNVYVAGSRNAKVFEFDPELNPVSSWTHPAFGDVLPEPGQDLSIGPAGMVFDSQGRLVVAAYAEFCVFSEPGVVLACHPKISSQATENIIFDLDGNLYTTTATGGTDEIHKYDSGYGYVTTFHMPTGNVTGVTCDPQGNLYFGSQLGGGNGSVIYKVDKVTLLPLDTLSISGNVEGLQFASDGNLLAATGADIGILRITPTSPTTVLQTITRPDLHFSVPLTIDNTDRIYTADYENGSGTAPADLFIFDDSGTISATALPSEVWGPFGMVVAGVYLPCGAFVPQ